MKKNFISLEEFTKFFSPKDTIDTEFFLKEGILKKGYLYDYGEDIVDCIETPVLLRDSHGYFKTPTEVFEIGGLEYIVRLNYFFWDIPGFEMTLL